MGFANALAYFMIGIAFFALVIGLFFASQNDIWETTNGFEEKFDSISEKKNKASINITSIYNTSSNIFVIIENEGAIELNYSSINVYVNDVFLMRDESKRVISINQTTDLRNPGLWSPGEELIINIIASPINGTKVKIVNSYGASSENYLWN